MQQLSPNGQQIVSQISHKYGFSIDAVTHLLFSLMNGGGTMAQFSHPELGGSGQWMQGGMLMIGDMFNNALKSNVDALCYELSGILANQGDLQAPTSFQTQSQGSNSFVQGGGLGSSSLVMPDPSAQWYPVELGLPNSSGAQNNLKYAYFADKQRLAVQTNGETWLYDTLEYVITGVSQQQGGNNSLVFQTSCGEITLSYLPVISINGVIQSTNQQTSEPMMTAAPEIIQSITQLAELRDKGVLTEQEFTSKKAILLERL